MPLNVFSSLFAIDCTHFPTLRFWCCYLFPSTSFIFTIVHIFPKAKHIRTANIEHSFAFMALTLCVLFFSRHLKCSWKYFRIGYDIACSTPRPFHMAFAFNCINLSCELNMDKKSVCVCVCVVNFQALWIIISYWKQQRDDSVFVRHTTGDWNWKCNT